MSRPTIRRTARLTLAGATATVLALALTVPTGAAATQETWSPPLTLSDPDVANVAVASGADGTDAVGWVRVDHDTDPDRYEVEVAAREPGAERFGDPTPLGGGDWEADALDVAVADDGTVVAAWVDGDDDQELVLRVRERDPGTGVWSAVVALDHPGDEVEQVQVASAGGTTVVLWERDEKVWTAVRRDDGGWTRTRVSQAGSSAWDGAVAVAPDGSAVAVWHAAGAGVLQHRALPAGSSSWTPVGHLDALGGSPSLVAGADGRFHLATVMQVTESWGDVGFVRWATVTSSLPQPSGSWTAPQVLPGGPAFPRSARLAVTGDGTPVVAWLEIPEGVKAAVGEADGTWAEPTTLDVDGQSWLDAIGTAHGVAAAWTSRGTDVHVRGFDAATGSWSPRTTLATDESVDEVLLGAAPDGRLTAVIVADGRVTERSTPDGPGGCGPGDDGSPAPGGSETGGRPAPPRLTLVAAPKVKGKARVGARLRATAGRWSATPEKVAYRWFRGKTKVKGKAGGRSVYTVRKKDAGKRLKVRVTVTAHGVTATASSKATPKVARRRR